ncbi:MAG TPA: hypothetical protein VK498_00225 [Ferruginibacter sp.]|nr:hypothetical protein [Ferruginibacter sp.]
MKPQICDPSARELAKRYQKNNIKSRSKNILFAICGLVFLLGCSSDDAPLIITQPQDNPLLIKRIITSQNDTEFFLESQTFTYEDGTNKLIKAETRPDESLNFTYTGDLITKIYATNRYSPFGTRYDYSYDDTGKLTTVTIIGYSKFGGGPPVVRTYTYNPDNTIDFSTTGGNSGDTVLTFGTITLTGGEVTQVTTTYNSNSTTETLNYTYDDKNFYAKNILGYKNIAFTGIIGTQGINHNRSNITYTYNADNYPQAATYPHGAGIRTNEYIYE